MANSTLHSDLETGNLHKPAYIQDTDPGAIGAGKSWVDTSDGSGNWIFKVRNADNTDWETISGTIYLKKGYRCVLDMPFEEGGGEATRDFSGFGNTGTITGATWTTGKSGNALSFDGVDDYVNCGNGDSVNISNNITLAAWVNLDTLPGTSTQYTIIAKRHEDESNTWNSYQLVFYTNSSGVFGIHFTIWISETAQDLRVETSITTGVWTHIVGVYDGNQMDLYRDGSNIGTLSSVIGDIDTYSSVEVWVGAWYQSAPSGFLDGKIDEVLIYNKALSATEVTNLYNSY